MSENEKIEYPVSEVKDEELDAVVGGVNRPTKEYPCKGGCGKMLRFPGRYCDSCIKMLNSQGVYPPL